MRRKLDNKRFTKLLGINLRSSTYFAASTQTTVKRSAETQTQDFPECSLTSPKFIKRVKTNESTINIYDDLYCYERSEDSPQITFQSIQAPIPLQKSQYNIDPLYIQEYKDKEYNYKTRAIILNRIQDNCHNIANQYAHKAIYLYDLFLNKLTNKAVTQQQLRFLSLAMIFVTTKMNAETPKIADLLQQSTLNMTKQQLLQYERLILKVLDWNVNPLTIQDVLYEVILKFQVTFPNLKIYQSQHLMNHKIQIIDEEMKIINLILSVLVLDHNYLNYPLDDLAYAIIHQLYSFLIDNEFEDFLKKNNKTYSQIQRSIKFVSKFIRIIQSLNEKNLDLNSLEILKLVCE